MRKHNLTHKSRKVLCCVLTAAGLMMAVTACGGNEDAGQATAQQNIQGSVQDSVGPSDGAEDVLTEESNAIFGQITAIDGDTLTLALAEQPSRPDMEGTMQAGRNA